MYIHNHAQCICKEGQHGNRKSIQIGEQPTDEKGFRRVRGLKVQNWAK